MGAKTNWQIHRAARALSTGGVIAYPTEAVWGLGCDPRQDAAIQRLLHIKRRPWQKGLILIAANWEQIAPWVALEQAPDLADEIWPGHVTCLLPAAPQVSQLLRGTHDTLAVRISAHPPVRELCEAFGGAIVSTSANRSGRPTPTDLTRLRSQFGGELDFYLNAPLGKASRASRIMDPYSGRTLRE